MRLEAIHEYTRADGSPWWYIARWKNPSTGEKRPLPFHFEGSTCSRKMPDIPHGKRPLYRLHKLGQYPSEVVYLAEGESCADCLEGLGFLATTWPNGSKSVGAADWSPLAGRRIVLWPDNDTPGFEAVGMARRILHGLGSRAVVLDVERLGLPPKGDCVDWLRTFVERHGKRHLHEIPNGHDLARQEIEAFEVMERQVAA
ncbi:MAG TPA: hypothetical protein PKY05_03115 [Fibrobacteria bacterium]|nr:hypothetical protein [Fibrobacteria bacterium]